MEDLIKMVSEKTGISDTQAKMAVEMVLKVVKDKLPTGISGQLDGLMAGKNPLENIKGGVAEKLGGLF